MVSASLVGAESPAISGYRRRGLIAAIATIALLAVLPALLLLSYLQVPAVAFPRTLDDPSRLVSIDLPAGWYDQTSDQRSVVRTDSEGLYVEPDIRATTANLGVGRVSYFTVVITVGPLGKTSDQIHQEAVRAQQTRYAVSGGAYEFRSAAGGLSTTMSVPGQVLDMDTTTSEATAVVRTVTTPEIAVTILGYTDLQDDPDGLKLLELLEAARIAE